MNHTIFSMAIMTLIMCALAAPAVADQLVEWSYQPFDTVQPGRAEPPIPSDFVTQLVIDDDAAEAAFGLGAPTASQFMWFNRFSPGAGAVWLDEIWVLYPAGANMAVGNEVEILIFHDPDRDPLNGAELILSFSESIQAVDGDTFSIYQLGSPLLFENPGDILVGVINRWVESGVTSTTRPAALDTGASQNRSWVALWTGDPPSPALLPADNLMALVDDFVPGNWMIRAFGRQHLPFTVPTLNGTGRVVLVLLMAAAGALFLNRWRSS